MGNIMFAIFIGVLSLNFFTITYDITGINRVMYNIPIGIFESSIPLVQDSDVPNMYFDKDTLESKLTSYLSNSVKKYTSSYEISYYYYVQEDESICKTDYCTAVKVTLEAKIMLVSTYSKSMKFYIQSN